MVDWLKLCPMKERQKSTPVANSLHSPENFDLSKFPYRWSSISPRSDIWGLYGEWLSKSKWEKLTEIFWELNYFYFCKISKKKGLSNQKAGKVHRRNNYRKFRGFKSSVCLLWISVKELFRLHNSMVVTESRNFSPTYYEKLSNNINCQKL